MKKAMLLLLLAVFVFAKKPILVCCGAGLSKPMNILVKRYRQITKNSVSLRYAGGGELLMMLEMHECDVYIPGAKFFVKKAEKKGLINPLSIEDIALHIPVIVSNDLKVKSLKDFGKKGVRIVLGNVKACSIGKIQMKILKKARILKNARKNTIAYGNTVNQLLFYLYAGEADASIIWQDMTKFALKKHNLYVINIPEKFNVIKTIASAVAENSDNSLKAEEFNKFLISGEAKKIWKEYGFKLCKN